jgi:PEP-CTERM motif
MKSTILKALLLSTGFLVLGSINHASAATCNSSYTMATVTTPGFSCSLNFLTFSNFAYLPSVSLTSGCGSSGEPACPPEAPLPNPSSDITVNFSTLTSGEDSFTTPASPGNPITQVITNYSTGNSVNEFQNEMGVLQYLVTGFGGSVITEVDAAITGLATAGAIGELNTNLCEDAQFGGGAMPNGSCNGNVEDTVAQFLALTTPAGQQADGTPDWEASILFSSAGVYNEWDLSGGNTDPTSTANVTAVENDFINTPGIPEPSTFAMLGGGLVALTALRRRRKTNSL